MTKQCKTLWRKKGEWDTENWKIQRHDLEGGTKIDGMMNELTLRRSPLCMRAVGTSSSDTTRPLSSRVTSVAVDGVSFSNSVTACSRTHVYIKYINPKP